MANFLPPEHERQVNKLEWPYGQRNGISVINNNFDIISCEMISEMLFITYTEILFLCNVVGDLGLNLTW